VNESGGYMKSEEAKQPKNNQNCSDYPKHVLISLFLSAGTPAVMFPPTSVMLIHVRENKLQAGL
jgi:hypothetical protein